jgi:hypothetical protein
VKESFPFILQKIITYKSKRLIKDLKNLTGVKIHLQFGKCPNTKTFNLKPIQIMKRTENLRFIVQDHRLSHENEVFLKYD